MSGEGECVNLKTIVGSDSTTTPHPPSKTVPLSRCGSGTLGEKQHSVVFLYPRAASLPFWEGNICKATSFSHSKNIIPKKRTPIESPKMRKKEIHPKAYLPSSAKKQNLASPPYLVSFFFNLLDFTCFCTVLLCFVIFSPNSNCIPKIKSIINHIAIFFLIAA